MIESVSHAEAGTHEHADHAHEFHVEDAVVLLAFLHKDAAGGEDVGGGEGGALADLLLVDGDGVLLQLAADFALAGEHAHLGGEVDQRGTSLYGRAAHSVLRHAVEDAHQRGAVEGVELLGSGLAEEQFAGGDGGVIGLFAVHADGDVLGVTLGPVFGNGHRVAPDTDPVGVLFHKFRLQ